MSSTSFTQWSCSPWGAIDNLITVVHSIIFPLFWLSYSVRDCTLTLYDIHFPLSAVLSLQYGIHFIRSWQYYHHHGRLSPHDLTQIYLTLFPLFLLSLFVSVTHKHTHTQLHLTVGCATLQERYLCHLWQFGTANLEGPSSNGNSLCSHSFSIWKTNASNKSSNHESDDCTDWDYLFTFNNTFIKRHQKNFT